MKKINGIFFQIIALAMILLSVINSAFAQGECIKAYMVNKESCSPGHDGVAVVDLPAGLNSKSTIEWKKGGEVVSSSAIASGLTSGSYSVTVRSNACPSVVFYTGSVSITKEDACLVTVTITGPTSVDGDCNGIPEVTFAANASGGTPPYTFTGGWEPRGNVAFKTVRPGEGHFSVICIVRDADGNTGWDDVDGYAKKEECSQDPNEIKGPAGYDEELHFVNKTDKMNYTIEFENDPEFAMAPASRVKITYDVPENQRIASFRLADFGFGSFIFTVPSNVSSYSQRLDVSDSLDVWVDVTAGIDIINHQLFWIFQSIDPATGAEPASSQMGFLPINDSLGHGQGYVSFYISPDANVQTGDTVGAEALIVFDDNAPIGTNVWTNTFDAVAPTSTLYAEMNASDSLYCTFSFEAQDDVNGSGVQIVEVYVSANNADYITIGSAHPDSTLSYALENGVYYQFMSIATDNVGNREAFKAQPDTSINYNTAPIDLVLNGNSFYEYDPVNTMIGTLYTLDNDVNLPFVYELVSGEGDDDNGLFTIDGNILKTDTTFVCSRQTTFSVRIRTTDIGGLSYEKSFDLNEIIQHITPITRLNKSLCEGSSIDFYGRELVEAGTYTDTLTTAEGCDSIVIWYVKENPTYNVILDTIVCDEFVWHDSTYTQSGLISYTYTLATGCDSTINYNVTVNHSVEGVDVQIACDSLTWINGITYYESTNLPTYTYVGGAANGCDSTVTLQLTVNYSTHNVYDTTVCEAYEWHESIYTTSGTYTYDYTNADGCASVDTLYLTVNYGTHNVLDTIVCEAYEWHGTTYTTSDTYTYEYTNAEGCPSVDTLHLTVNYGTHNVIDTIVCESYEWHGTIYTTSDTYTYEYTNNNGCASVDTLHLTVNYGTHNVFDTTVCEAYEWHGTTYTTSDTYTYEYTNNNGCASVDTLHLTVNYGTHNVFDTTVCEAYEWHGMTYTTSDTYTYEYINADGCASVDTLHLTVNYGTHNVIDTIVCESYEWHGTIYTTSDTYTYEYTNNNGCASVDTLHLTVNYGTHNVFDTTVCEAYEWHGTTYTTSDTYTYEYTNNNGCASVDTLHLTVNYGMHNVFDTTVCESYEWHGTVYTVSGTYTYAYDQTNTYGCVDVDTLHLTINYGTHNVFDTTVCEAYEWHGTTYTTSDTYTYEYTNNNGCASVDTLHLTVNYGTHNVFDTTVCEAYEWHGTTYTTSDTYTYEYTNNNGCASVDTLHLTVNYGTHNVFDTIVCEAYEWHGTTYTTSDTYTYEYINASGCASVDTLHLTVNHSTTGIDMQEACDSLLWIDGVTYYESTSDVNAPTFTLTNAAGCDSVVTLNLSLNHSVTVDYYLTISDDDLPFTYGDTTFLPGTVQSGDYTIVLETADGCDSVVTLHLTVTGINDYLMNMEMNVYPNPTNDKVNVQLSVNNAVLTTKAEIQLYDMYGKWLKTWKVTSETTEIDLSPYAASVYFIKLVDGQRMIGVRKVVKE